MEPAAVAESPTRSESPARPAAPAPSAGEPPLPARRQWLTGRLAFESALIVLSVLLGLALGELREHLRERALARTALANFRREIAGNLARLEQVRPRHVAMAERLAAAAAATTGAAGAAAGAGTAFDVFIAQMPRGGLDNQPLRDVAWETAQTTGALRLLDYETAALLSETYLVQRTTLRPTLQLLAERFLSPANFDPVQRAAMVRTHRMLLVELSGQEGYLIEIYRRTLARLPAPRERGTARP